MRMRIEANDYFGFMNDDARITLDDEKLLYFDSANGEVVQVKDNYCLVCNFE